MASPDDRRYLDSHEWHKLEDNVVLIGISQFAVDELTDITFLEIEPGVGDPVTQGEAFGEIESVKATSELNSGIDGEVLAVNEEVLDNPALINDNPYENWMLKIKPRDPAQLDALLAAADYDAGQND